MVRYPNSISAGLTDIKNGSNKYIRRNITLDELSNHVLAVDVFYSHLGYSETSEIAKTTVVNLFCNIGGLTGLFLGMSLLSFIEIIELFCEIIYINTNFGLNKAVINLKP